MTKHCSVVCVFHIFCGGFLFVFWVCFWGGGMPYSLWNLSSPTRARGLNPDPHSRSVDHQEVPSPTYSLSNHLLVDTGYFSQLVCLSFDGHLFWVVSIWGAVTKLLQTLYTSLCIIYICVFSLESGMIGLIVGVCCLFLHKIRVSSRN